MVSACRIISYTSGSSTGMSATVKGWLRHAPIRSSARRMADSMPSARTSTFRSPSASRSFLSHSMTLRSFIAAFSIGTKALEGPSRDDEAADVLGQMPREAEEGEGKLDRPLDYRARRIEPHLENALGKRAPVVPPGEVLRQPVEPDPDRDRAPCPTSRSALFGR